MSDQTPTRRTSPHIPHIPHELRERAQWIVCRGKEPWDASAGCLLKRWTAPAAWLSYEEARALASSGVGLGVGFVFTEADPFVGIDLDHCADAETGDVDQWALEIVEHLATFTERSTSGTGLHLYARAELPRALRRKLADPPREGAGVELYASGRFFVFTGDHLEGTPLTVESRADQVLELWQSWGGEEVAEEGTQGPAGAACDDEALDEAIQSALGALPAPTSNEDWTPVAMALHHAYAGSERGWRLLCAWSKRDSAYTPRVEDKNRTRWQSFGKRTRGPLVGVGTVFGRAREAGWGGIIPVVYRRGAQAYMARASSRFPHPRWRYDDGALVLDLEAAYVRCEELVEEALERPGLCVLASTPGTGKTRATVRALARWMVEHPEARVVWITPTHLTEAEAIGLLRAELDALEAATWAGGRYDRQLRAMPVRTAQTCYEFDRLNAVRHAYPEASGDACANCWRNPHNDAPSEVICPFWTARRERAATLEVMTHHRACLAAAAGDLRADIVVWDENPLGACRTTLQLDASAVIWAARVLGWSRAQWTPLVELMQPSVKVLGEVLADHLEVIAPPDDLDARRQRAREERREQGRRAMAEGRGVEWAADLPDWRSLEALVEVAQDWRTAQVKGTTLEIPYWRGLHAHADTTIILDATMTRPLAEAMWGDAFDEYHAIRVDLPEHTRVTWLRTNLATRDVADSTPRSGRRGLLWSAAHGLYHGEDWLHVTHKGHTEGEGVCAEACKALAADGAQVIYYLGSEGTGWNGAARASGAVLDTFYPPHHAVEALAQDLTRRHALPDDPETLAMMREQAWHHLRTRTIVQTAHRVRPVRASAERPVHLVFALEDNPTPYGFAPDEQVSEAELLWRAYGILERGGVELLAGVLRRCVEASDGVFVGTRAPLTLGDVWQAPPNTPALALARQHYADQITQAHARHAYAALRDAAAAAGLNMAELARVAGVQYLEGFTGGRGVAAPIFHALASAVDVARRLAGDFHEIGPPGVAEDERISCHDLDQLDHLWRRLQVVREDATPAPYSALIHQIHHAPGHPFATRRKAQELMRRVGGLDGVRERVAEARGTTFANMLAEAQAALAPPAVDEVFGVEPPRAPRPLPTRGRRPGLRPAPRPTPPTQRAAGAEAHGITDTSTPASYIGVLSLTRGRGALGRMTWGMGTGDARTSVTFPHPDYPCLADAAPAQLPDIFARFLDDAGANEADRVRLLPALEFLATRTQQWRGHPYGGYYSDPVEIADEIDPYIQTPRADLQRIADQIERHELERDLRVQCGAAVDLVLDRLQGLEQMRRVAVAVEARGWTGGDLERAEVQEELLALAYPAPFPSPAPAPAPALPAPTPEDQEAAAVPACDVAPLPGVDAERAPDHDLHTRILAGVARRMATGDLRLVRPIELRELIEVEAQCSTGEARALRDQLGLEGEALRRIDRAGGLDEGAILDALRALSSAPATPSRVEAPAPRDDGAAGVLDEGGRAALEAALVASSRMLQGGTVAKLLGMRPSALERACRRVDSRGLWGLLEDATQWQRARRLDLPHHTDPLARWAR